MAEKQSCHRQKMEHKMIFDSLFHEKLGIILGFILSVPALGIGIYFLFKGNNAAGSITVIPFFAQIISIFATRGQNKANNNDNKKNKK